MKRLLQITLGVLITLTITGCVVGDYGYTGHDYVPSRTYYDTRDYFYPGYYDPGYFYGYQPSYSGTVIIGGGHHGGHRWHGGHGWRGKHGGYGGHSAHGRQSGHGRGGDGWKGDGGRGSHGGRHH